MAMHSQTKRDWFDPSYLKKGTPRQREAWAVLDSLGIFDGLKEYQPVLCGTIPLDIDVEDSDLDLICTTADLDRFGHVLKEKYGHLDHFTQDRGEIRNIPTATASFWYRGFQLECFAQPIPVTEQNAYRHMMIEARLLQLSGQEAAKEIRALKERGLKTEPAFALYYGIVGDDPYQALLELERYSNEQLKQVMANKPT
ncbi:DUF4269 domain-containing protein [Brevibacillus borstelensis]|jgi:Domain of unknown function (DUF4269)|nr:DUF4269 domain-containing protein [Brevibacillus borstelensis]